MRFSLIALCAFPEIAHAQSANETIRTIATASVGRTARVRTDSSGFEVMGSIARIAGDTVFILGARGNTQPVLTSAITRFDIREAIREDVRRRRERLGIGLGALVGAAIGYAIATPRVHTAEQAHNAPLEQIEYVTDPLIGGLVGAALGGIAARLRSTEWVTRYP